ncbi:D-alanine--poly(phosphoribitol) ligase [Amycolatopsis thailandensis]|uniref:D-alanine--poly(Phosphoribitol) ligase n=1 Tax=Amycolatopsis thailandensis TaxID=589330 RepID=A0A229SI05_9PSEU|nr:AMP-binding protein [Amycolatopsis thailandensis]OXM58507.1 D-alanine--poly(phosphoribitol) ligase [Amycolatopsis thailandensis]
MNLRDLVPFAARRTPDAPAVADLATTLTYAELEATSAASAAALHALGVRPGDRVVLWAEKSAELVAVLQGVLRVGAVYVPVAPGNPVERVRRIIDDCGAALLVTDQTPETNCPKATPAQVSAGHGTAAAPVPVGPDDPVYIVYTSGSTGAPKGVVMSDRAALTFVEWAVTTTGLTPDDRLANHASFNFDLSVFDLYGAFSVGASVHLIPEALTHVAPMLVDFVRDHEISVWYSVPSALVKMIEDGELLARGPGRLRMCVFAGEPVPLPACRRLLTEWPATTVFNWYGPTEAIVCTSHQVTPADLERSTPLPAGRAACGNDVRLTVDGEIVVDGPTVMLGYWGRESRRGPHHTGDLGRFDADGTLHCLGRQDDMVKVRGHRIEPGEVEAALSLHEDVAQVVVFGSGSGAEARLHAVVRPHGERRPGLGALRQHCARYLPPYMRIDFLHLREHFPLNPNGKVDRPHLVREVLREAERTRQRNLEAPHVV